MPFLTDCVLKVIAGDTWLLVEPLVYQHKTYGELTVPAGFKTDLASIPRFFHRIVNPCSVGTRRPAVVHDYLYTGKTNLTRIEADKVLYDALRECGVNLLVARGMYYAVRAFGGSHWSV